MNKPRNRFSSLKRAQNYLNILKAVRAGDDEALRKVVREMERKPGKPEVTIDIPEGNGNSSEG